MYVFELIFSGARILRYVSILPIFFSWHATVESGMSGPNGMSGPSRTTPRDCVEEVGSEREQSRVIQVLVFENIFFFGANFRSLLFSFFFFAHEVGPRFLNQV